MVDGEARRLELPDGGYQILANTLGNLSLYRNQNGFMTYMSAHQDLGEAMAAAESTLGSPSEMQRRISEWKNSPPSEAQLILLTKLLTPILQREGLTVESTDLMEGARVHWKQGQVSNLITALLSKRQDAATLTLLLQVLPKGMIARFRDHAEQVFAQRREYVTTFLHLTFLKVSQTDEYGDERWDLLPAAIQQFVSNKLLKGISGDGLLSALTRELLQEVYRQYHEQQKARRTHTTNLDGMTGLEFELYIAQRLRDVGYSTVTTTPGSGDFGADIVIHDNREVIVVQCKRHQGPVGVHGIQEAIGAQHHYAATQAWVVVTSTFTAAAKKLAQTANVQLYDKNNLAASDCFRKLKQDF